MRSACCMLLSATAAAWMVRLRRRCTIRATRPSPERAARAPQTAPPVLQGRQVRRQWLAREWAHAERHACFTLSMAQGMAACSHPARTQFCWTPSHDPCSQPPATRSLTHDGSKVGPPAGPACSGGSRSCLRLALCCTQQGRGSSLGLLRHLACRLHRWLSTGARCGRRRGGLHARQHGDGQLEGKRLPTGRPAACQQLLSRRCPLPKPLPLALALLSVRSLLLLLLPLEGPLRPCVVLLVAGCLRVPLAQRRQGCHSPESQA